MFYASQSSKAVPHIDITAERYTRELQWGLCLPDILFRAGIVGVSAVFRRY
jgi:hypothetical protein